MNNKQLIEHIRITVSAALELVAGTGISAVFGLYDPEENEVLGDCAGPNGGQVLAVGTIESSLVAQLAEDTGNYAEFHDLYELCLFAAISGDKNA